MSKGIGSPDSDTWMRGSVPRCSRSVKGTRGADHEQSSWSAPRVSSGPLASPPRRAYTSLALAGGLMSLIDLSPLEPVLAALAPLGRSALLPALHAAQDVYGHLPEPVAAAVGRALRVPLSEVYGVIDFYSMFYREPVGRTLVRVCADPACALAGSDAVLAAACAHAGVEANGTSADGALTVERVTCLGLCEHAPAALVNKQARGHVRPDEMHALFS